MTVQELIDKLIEYPSDMEVRIVLPRRKFYEPEYTFDVQERFLGDWDEGNKGIVLRRGKQVF